MCVSCVWGGGRRADGGGRTEADGIQNLKQEPHTKMWGRTQFWPDLPKNYFLRVIPTLNPYSDIVSDIPTGNIYGTFILTFYLTISDILSGIYFDILSDILSGIYSDTLSGTYSGIYSDILSGIFSDIHSGICSDILSDILSGICICVWHIFWHSFWHSYWYIFEGSLWSGSGWDHSAPELAVRVRRGTLRSSACSWSPAGSTLILCLLFGSGREPSSACSWGPAGITLILSSLFGSGRERPSASSWGPAGITLILSSLFGSGGEHYDLALAVEVRRRRRRRRRRDSWHKI